LRIYPAFVVVYCLCILVVGPLSGADMKTLSGIGRIFYMLLLQPPWLAGAFADLHYPALNSSMGRTIAYEFRCYLAIAALGIFGILRIRRAFLILAGALLTASVFNADMKLSNVELALVGDPHDTGPICVDLLLRSCPFMFFATLSAIAIAWRSSQQSC
jgi:peptidoglycan/LPS O-acetylase OafA/YrhL